MKTTQPMNMARQDLLGYSPYRPQVNPLMQMLQQMNGMQQPQGMAQGQQTNPMMNMLQTMNQDQQRTQQRQGMMHQNMMQNRMVPGLQKSMPQMQQSQGFAPMGLLQMLQQQGGLGGMGGALQQANPFQGLLQMLGRQ